MCVICHKERGVDIPSKEIFEKCFNKNPHGSGILVHRQGTDICEIHKGFMTFDKFTEALGNLNIKKEDDAVFHFRITTSGGTNAENCHPFPISQRVEDLKATRINTALAFIHNGIVGKGDTVAKISDTQVLIRDIISRDEIRLYLENTEIQKIIKEICGTSNRFLVIDSSKDIFMRYGSWIKDECGCWFSNSYWKYTAYDYSSYYGSSSSSNSSSHYYGSGMAASKNDFPTTPSRNLASFLPDINTILCPYCDTKMGKLLEGMDYYMCQSCGTIYDDRTFSLYNKLNSRWESIIEINNFDSC